MAQGTVSQSIAAQAEFLRPELENLTLAATVLYKRLTVRSDIHPVSNRPSRIPFQTQTGGRPKVASFDGQSLGRGTAPNETPGSLSCVSFLQASEYTALAEWSTDNTEKAIQNFVALTNEQAADTFGKFLDSLIVAGDGSNTIDTVVSVSGQQVVVNNANKFADQQYVDVWSGLGGTKRGTFQIQSIDTGTTSVWTVATPPAGTTTGDLLLPEDSAGTANSGLFGLTAYQSGGNTGNYMGIPKGAYPGKFSTPNIDLGQRALTPAIVRQLQMQQMLALGTDNNGEDNVCHCNVDVLMAWENNALNVQSIIRNQIKGDESTDMLGKSPVKQIAGRDVLLNIVATPGVLDFLSLTHWFIIQTRANDLYEVGGQTTFPTYGSDGGLSSSCIFYLATVFQVGNGQPRKGARLQNIAVPPNIFTTGS